MTKEPTGRGFPRPPKIEDHFTQRLERGRQSRDHVISVIGRHWRSLMKSKSVNLAAKILASSIPSPAGDWSDGVMAEHKTDYSITITLSRLPRGLTNKPSTTPVANPLRCAAMLICGVERSKAVWI